MNILEKIKNSPKLTKLNKRLNDMARSIYDDSNQYRSILDQVSESSSWTIRQKFALFGQILVEVWVIYWLGDHYEERWATSPPLITPALSCSSVQLQIIMSSSFNYFSVTLSPDLGIWALFFFLFVQVEALLSYTTWTFVHRNSAKKL